jgi:S1-C subfamily serine protease
MKANMRRRLVSATAAALGALAAGAGVARVTRVVASGDTTAVAYVRVVGDVRVESKDVYQPPQERRGVELATGTGFVIAPSGLILTNDHVVRPELPAREGLAVTLSVTSIEAVVRSRSGDEQRLEAAVVGSDPEEDLAVLAVTGADLPHLPFGDSDAAQAGQPVRVFGFPFGRRLEVGRDSPTPDVTPAVNVTAGTFTASRANDQGDSRYLQTDASIHPGNSGGPMVDADGYAVGLVRMKLRGVRNVGFAIPINRAKDFLERTGFLHLLPTRRLRLGGAQSFDAKRVGVQLPEGWDDSAPERVRMDSGPAAESLSFVADRIASAWDAPTLERALLAGHGFQGFAQGASTRREEKQAGRRIQGSARGVSPVDGRALWMEYAILDLRKEKLVARYVGAPDELAFNMSVLRASLAGLTAERLLGAEVASTLPVDIAAARLGDPAAPPVSVPAGFELEYGSPSTCSGLPRADGLVARPPGDFTVAFRIAFWRTPPFDLAHALSACAGQGGVFAGGAYTTQSSRFGVAYAGEGRVVEVAGGLLQLELDAPQTKLPFLRELHANWLRAHGSEPGAR